MAGISAVVSSVGAGESQGRIQGIAPTSQLKDQEPTTDNARSAALQLIMSAISTPDSAGHDLDVLA